MFGVGHKVRTRPAAKKRRDKRACLLGGERNLFEDQQEQLEQHVEHLSRSLAEAGVVAGTPDAGIVRQKQTAVTLAKTVEHWSGWAKQHDVLDVAMKTKA